MNRICPICNIEFKPKQYNQVYCKSKCYRKEKENKQYGYIKHRINGKIGFINLLEREKLTGRVYVPEATKDHADGRSA